MEFDNTFEVPLPPEQAWPVLIDIRRIAPCMPGAQLTEVVDDRTYKGNIAVRLGPVALTFAGLVKFEEIDDAIRYGAGLRWAFMGTFLTYRIAGGDAGMRNFMAQFGPALAWPWTKLTDVPELTDDLLDRLVSQSDTQAGDRSIRELERARAAGRGVLDPPRPGVAGGGRGHAERGARDARASRVQRMAGGIRGVVAAARPRAPHVGRRGGILLHRF